ncbi:MAG: hypothetical protein IIZ06_05420 [Kiritimatiellae bacterium]|nr:hypothetical protein [Kiritimatiellia bacterium]
MLDVSVDIDENATRRLESLFERFEREMPDRLAGATRRAGIYVLKSLKARTLKAPKRMRRVEYVLTPRKGGYITRDGNVFHLWNYVHLPGTSDEKRKTFGAYATRTRTSDTRWKWRGLKKADERREIIEYRHLLEIRRAGLAKLSWDWIAAKIMQTHGGAVSWKRTRGERRDPRNFVRGLFRRIMGKGAAVLIQNELDYILRTLPAGAIGEALNAASKRLEWNIEQEAKKALT